MPPKAKTMRVLLWRTREIPCRRTVRLPPVRSVSRAKGILHKRDYNRVGDCSENFSRVGCKVALRPREWNRNNWFTRYTVIDVANLSSRPIIRETIFPLQCPVHRVRDSGGSCHDRKYNFRTVQLFVLSPPENKQFHYRRRVSSHTFRTAKTSGRLTVNLILFLTFLHSAPWKPVNYTRKYVDALDARVINRKPINSIDQSFWIRGSYKEKKEEKKRGKKKLRKDVQLLLVSRSRGGITSRFTVIAWPGILMFNLETDLVPLPPARDRLFLISI